MNDTPVVNDPRIPTVTMRTFLSNEKITYPLHNQKSMRAKTGISFLDHKRSGSGGGLKSPISSELSGTGTCCSSELRARCRRVRIPLFLCLLHRLLESRHQVSAPDRSRSQSAALLEVSAFLLYFLPIFFQFFLNLIRRNLLIFWSQGFCSLCCILYNARMRRIGLCFFFPNSMDMALQNCLVIE